MSILEEPKTIEDFEKLCNRLINCRKWWETATENEHKAQEVNLLNLCDLIDNTFLRLNEIDKERALQLLTEACNCEII